MGLCRVGCELRSQELGGGGAWALKKEVDVSRGIHLLSLLSPVSPPFHTSELLELEETSCSGVLHLQQGMKAPGTSQPGEPWKNLPSTTWYLQLF